MKCKYCQRESVSEFCSKEHKRMFQDGINDALIQNCPTIITKGLDEKLLKMQEDWKKKNKKKAKKQLLFA